MNTLLVFDCNHNIHILNNQICNECLNIDDINQNKCNKNYLDVVQIGGFCKKCICPYLCKKCNKNKFNHMCIRCNLKLCFKCCDNGSNSFPFKCPSCGSSTNFR